MVHIELYTTGWCSYCRRAKTLLGGRGVAYDEIDITWDGRRKREMHRRSGRTSVPQVFIDGVHIGGFDDLASLAASGELDRMIDG